MDVIHRSQVQTMETSVRNAREMIEVKNQLDVAAQRVRDIFLKCVGCKQLSPKDESFMVSF